MAEPWELPNMPGGGGGGARELIKGTLRERLIAAAQKRDEFVLPSGMFCSIRPLTAADIVAYHAEKDAKKATGEVFNAAAFLLSRACLFDGEALALEDFDFIDARDWLKLDGMISNLLQGPVK